MTGITTPSKDVIAFVLKSPKADAQKAYEVLNEAESGRFLDAAEEPREFVQQDCQLPLA